MYKRQTDTQAHRIEHPGLTGVVCRLGRAGNRLLVNGEERAHVEIDGAAAGKPWVLDPVGLGIGSLRTQLVNELKQYKPAIVRGNRCV